MTGPRTDGNHAVLACDTIHVHEPLVMHMGNLPAQQHSDVCDKGTGMEIVVTNGPATGLTTKEAEMYAKLKVFCSSIVKKLAPPILREV